MNNLKPSNNGSLLSDARNCFCCNYLLLLALGMLCLPGQSQTVLNVKNFGAVGNAVQFYANTISNSPVVTTITRVPPSAIGDAIELWGCGKQTYGKDSYGTNAYHYTDLICNITNVVNATNLYVDQLPQQTLDNTFATYGHDNRANFQAAFDAVKNADTVINVPAGTYLLLGINRPNDPPPRNDPTCWYAVKVQKGGWHLRGEGTNNTILLGQGAWQQRSFSIGNNAYSNICKRAAIFGIVPTSPAMPNDYPASIENLTLDGGVVHGDTTIHGTYVNNFDGQGWDGSHGAIITRGFPGSTITSMTWSNLLIAHWRGEMVKSLDRTTNGNLLVENCVFKDGNATAVNYYASTTWTNCIFENLYQVGEYYQAYNTNACVMENCLITNIWVNGWAINGGSYKAPPFIIRNNRFYFDGPGRDGILTVPACNVFIYSNTIVAENSAAGHFYGIVIGAAGYQGTSCNSNIVVFGNTFSNVSTVISYGSGNPPSGGIYTDGNWTTKLYFYQNYIAGEDFYPTITSCNGWATDVNVYSNTVAPTIKIYTPSNAKFISGGRGEAMTLIPTNNIYWKPTYDFSGNRTNYIDYGNGGSRWQVFGKYLFGSVYALVTTNASQIPANAQIILKNSTTDVGYGDSVPIYLNSSATGKPLMIPNGQTATFDWNGAKWINSASKAVTLPRPMPPTSLRVLD